MQFKNLDLIASRQVNRLGILKGLIDIAIRAPHPVDRPQSARAAGIDLSREFFFPPGDPRFDEILTRVNRELDARIARLRRDKKKLAATKVRSRRQDLAAAPRVKNKIYKFEMQENA